MVFYQTQENPTSSTYTLLNLPDEEEQTTATTNPPLSSQLKTFANVFISIVGAGVLGLPYTFKKTGWLMGSLILFSVAALTYHCMMLLIQTRRKLNPQKINSFGDLGFSVCGSPGRFAVDSMIVLSQAGFCVSYLIFVATTLAFIFNFSPNPQSSFNLTPKSMFIWGCFPFQLGLNSIPTLTHLAPLSIFADVVDIGAMGVVMVEDWFIFMKEKQVLKAFGGFSVFFYGLGVAVYAFEGIGMVLPLELEMREKNKFGKVLGLSMGFISLMYGGFGVLGYFAFGEETKDIITTNLGQGVLSYFVQLGLCVNLFLTFPVMMNPVYEVVERRVCEGRYSLWVRWGLVLGVSLVALLVPNFADFLSLVGSSVCVVLGFVLPALFLAIFGTWSSLVEIFAPKA